MTCFLAITRFPHYSPPSNLLLVSPDYLIRRCFTRLALWLDFSRFRDPKFLCLLLTCSSTWILATLWISIPRYQSALWIGFLKMCGTRMFCSFLTCSRTCGHAILCSSIFSIASHLLYDLILPILWFQISLLSPNFLGRRSLADFYSALWPDFSRLRGFSVSRLFTHFSFTLRLGFSLQVLCSILICSMTWFLGNRWSLIPLLATKLLDDLISCDSVEPNSFALFEPAL